MTPRGWRRSIRAAVVTLVLFASPAGAPHLLRAQAAEPQTSRRLALVIGEANYPAGPLPTAIRDAALVAQALAQAGFAVTAAGDVDGATLRSTVASFVARAKAAGPDVVTFVYLSGYGLQYDGDSYVVPVDAAPRQADDVPGTTIRLADLVRELDAIPAKARILVEDLAREQSFVRQDEPLAGGLPLVEASRGSIIAYNAAPGTVAPPGVTPYGVYARALAEMIEQPGLALGEMFKRVRLRVGTVTNGAAIPWDDDRLEADEALISPPPGSSGGVRPAGPVVSGVVTASAAFSTSVADDTLAGYQSFLKTYPRAPEAARMLAIVAARREATIWAESRRADDPRELWTYMRRYPRGPHLFDARRRLAALHAALEPPPRFDIFVYPDVTPPSAAEAAIVDRPFVVLDDPSWTPVPPPPSTLVGAPREAFYEDLPPPPLAPAGVLPIPVPVPLEGVRYGAAVVPGRIVQPGGTDVGDVVVESKVGPGVSSVMTMLAADGRVIARTATSVTPGLSRTIVQTNGADSLISRTVTTRERGTLTTIQSGPGGAVLFKAVSHANPDGGRATNITSGSDRVIASLQSNADGVTTLIQRGPVPVPDQSYVLASAIGAKPVVASLSEVPSRVKTVVEAARRPTSTTQADVSDASARPPMPSLPPLTPPPLAPLPSSLPQSHGGAPASPYGRLGPGPSSANTAALGPALRTATPPAPAPRSGSGARAAGEPQPVAPAAPRLPQPPASSTKATAPPTPPRRETRPVPISSRPRTPTMPRRVERPRIVSMRRPAVAQRAPVLRQPPARAKVAPVQPATGRRAKPVHAPRPAKQPARSRPGGRKH